MRDSRPLFLAGVAIAALAWAGPADAQQRVALSGNDVALYDLAGNVRVEAGSGPSVDVEVTPGGSDASKLRVVTGRVGGWQTMRVIFPSDHIIYRPMGSFFSNVTLRVRDDGTFGDPRIWPDGGKEPRSGGDRVMISGRGFGLDAHADLVVHVPAGRRVAIFMGAGQATVRNVEGRLRLDVSSGGVTAQGIHGEVLAGTGSGAVQLSDVTGAASAETGSGSIRIDRVRGERIHLDTGSGHIEGSDLATSDLYADTGSGSIRLAGVAAPSLSLDTGSGGVELALTTDVQSLKIDTGSGSVRLSVPSSLGAEVVIDTGSGGISTAVPMTFTKHRRDHVEGRMGDGNGKITIDTGSGGVQLERS